MSIIISYVSCKKEKNVLKEKINGVSQKGPFVNGSSITLFELSSNLSSTGKSFNATMTDNKGSFELRGLELKSQYVKLKADGFYFNEVTGKPSISQITLYALSDISNKSTVNVNILSHLEYQRIEYLVSKGSSFDEAKKQAKNEILKIFSITKQDFKDPEALDIAREDDDNAILLAISIIIQGNRTEAELTNLMAGIITDVKEDGVLNSEAIGSELINDAKFLDLNKVRTNIETQYKLLDPNAKIPQFEKYIQYFTANTTYKFNRKIIYPQTTDNWNNVLFQSEASYNINKPYGFSADVYNGGALKIILRKNKIGTNYIEIYYGFNISIPLVNWTVGSQYEIRTGNDIDVFRRFDVTKGGVKSTATITFFRTGNYQIEYYENGATTPTFVKNFTIVQ